MTGAAMLLADPSPCLRMLVLRDLMGRPADDPEVEELRRLRDRDPVLAPLQALQRPDGSWPGRGASGLGSGDDIRATAQALLRVGYVGFDPDHEMVRRGVAFLLAHQRDDGSWPLPDSFETDEGQEGYSIIPLQTALPLRALAACGRAADPQAELAYRWLLDQRLPDGAWPTGIAAGTLGGVAGYRRIPHSKWGCRSNTTGALACLALHPTRRVSAEARRALDLLLGRETREQQNIGFEVARIVGAEPTRGFLTYFARFDLAQMLNLCRRVGVSADDPRVEDLISFVRELHGPYGLWEYAAHPEVSRWVTFDILRSLTHLEEAPSSDWLSTEPRTPFQPYPHRPKRH